MVQADLIAKLKATTSLTSVLPSGTYSIKEYEWQGDEFQYPNVRFDLEDNRYELDEQEKCQLQNIEFSIYIYSEQRTSKECSQIKGVIATALIGLGFTGTYAKYTRLRLMENIPAVRVEERVFRSQLKLTTFVQNLG